MMGSGSTAIKTGLGASILAAATVFLAPNFTKEDVILPVITGIGHIAGVNTTLDKTYTDFYIVACEIAGRGNIHPQELAKLDPKNTYYLVTGVRENQDQSFTQRSFVLTEAQVKKIGLRNTAKQNDKVLLSDQKINIEALGQYLRSTYSLLNFDVYPQAQNISLSNGTSAQASRVEEAVRNGRTGISFRAHMNFNR